MSTPVPGSFASLGTDLFQVPAQPAPPPITPSGGVGAPPGSPVTVPGGTYPPAQQPYQPTYQQPAPTPPAITPPPQASPRAQLDRLVSQGVLTQAEALEFQSDERLFDALVTTTRPTTPVTPPPVLAPPAVPITTTTTAPATSDLTAAAQALQAHGLLEMRGGVYVAKAPEAGAIADSLNRQLQDRERTLQELHDPQSWLKKHGEQVFDPRFQTLEQKIAQLESQLAAAKPKPHEQWVAQHQDQLYQEQNGQRVFSPAGNAYKNTWDQLATMGYTDVDVLHASASQAAMAAMQAAPAPAPQQTFLQAAAASSRPLTPGFNLPGTSLSNQQNPQDNIPVNSRGMPDWNAIQAGLANGSIPRM